MWSFRYDGNKRNAKKIIVLCNSYTKNKFKILFLYWSLICFEKHLSHSMGTPYVQNENKVSK
jgi:hypothetical protein